jgi:hypothetical protein
MHDGLSHRQGIRTDVDSEQQLALGGHGAPYPTGRAGQTLDRLVLTQLAIFEGANHSHTA